MTTEITVQPKYRIKEGQTALIELRNMISRRPEKERLIVGGKQYLFFSDWQTLGAFFEITAKVLSTEEIKQDGQTIGFIARASALHNGQEISAAEAECCFDEPNWEKKPRFQLRSMAQTRACSKALRNCLAWVVRLPGNLGTVIADTPAEEIA